MVCELRVSANPAGFTVLDVASPQHHLQVELRGQHVWLHHADHSQAIDSRHALHALLRQLILLQSVEHPA